MAKRWQCMLQDWPGSQLRVAGRLPPLLSAREFISRIEFERATKPAVRRCGEGQDCHGGQGPMPCSP
jgi:hypothetical protein